MARTGPTTESASKAHVPPSRDLRVLRAAAAGCTACPLHLLGSQTVFGEGPRDALAMLVGEQPGDLEDRAGRPFVGPAGRLLDELLAEAGLDRRRLYLTNAVKHFKFVAREQKRRLHQKPSGNEVKACRGWLEAELESVRPRRLLALGATAAQSLLGSRFRLTQHLGQPFRTAWAPWFLATLHPSALLRMPDADARHEARRQFVRDLRLLARAIADDAPARESSTGVESA